jgi:hypothetical protein
VTALRAPDQGSRLDPRDQDRLSTETARELVGAFEWTLLVYQVGCIAGSLVFDSYDDRGRLIVAAVAVVHLLLIPVYLRGGGPFRRGGWWIAATYLTGLVVPTVVILMIEPYPSGASRIGADLIGVPLFTYSAGFWVLLAAYPWLPRTNRVPRPVYELLLLLTMFLYVLGVVYWANGRQLTWLNAGSVGVTFAWSLLAYALGKGLSRMCAVAADRETRAQRQTYMEFFDFLHSHVEASVAAVRMEIERRPACAKVKLDELERTVSDYRVRLLLSGERVPLATLLSEGMRTFAGLLTIVESPRVGALTAPRQVAILVSRAIGDLMKNAAMHGASSVGVTCTRDDRVMTISVADDGPGFSADILDDESRSLFRLRQSMRLIGGDLTKSDGLGGQGSTLQFSVPMEVNA